MLWLLCLSSAAALKPTLAPPLQSNGPHGLPLLPSGEHLTLDAPGWTRGIGTGGRVWPAAAALCRYLARTGMVRGKAVLELGCGTGATGLHCAAALNASSVVLTEGGSEGLLQLARRNVEACVEINLNAIEQTREWRQPRVDGVESTRHRAAAVTGMTSHRWREAPEV